MEEPGPHTPTYPDVSPLFATSRVSGDKVEYVFRCPITGAEFVGTVTVATEPIKAPLRLSPTDLAREDVGDRADMALDRALPNARLAWELASGVFQWRRGKRRMQSPSPAPPPDPAAVAAAEQHAQQMMLDAFATVAEHFTWDGTRWVSSGA